MPIFSRHPSFWIFIGVPTLAVASLPYSAGDLAAWTFFGSKILESGTVSIPAWVSVLPQKGSVFPSWGISVFYAWLYPWIGLQGLALLNRLLAPVLLALLWHRDHSRRDLTQSFTSRFATYSIWCALIPVLGERPSVLGLLFLILVLIQLEHLKMGRVRSWLPFVGLELLWANTHGSFVLLPLLALWRLSFGALRVALRSGWQSRVFYVLLFRSGCFLAAILMASGVNPFGVRIYSYVIENSLLSKNRGIVEWASTRLLTEPPTGILYFLLLALTAILCMRFLKAGPSARKVLRKLQSPFWPLLGLGSTAIRMAPLAFIALPDFLKQPSFRKAEIGQSRSLWWGAGLIWMMILLLLSPVRSGLYEWTQWQRLRTFDDEVPVQLLSLMTDPRRESCPVFTEMETSGAVMLMTHRPVFLHTQHLEFEDSVFWSYWNELNHPRGPEDYLDRYGACLALIDRNLHADFATQLTLGSRWIELGRQGNMILLGKAKRDGSNESRGFPVDRSRSSL